MPRRGELVLMFPVMWNKLSGIPDGTEWVDERRYKGHQVRVPTIMIDAKGIYWWMGMRASNLVNGVERVAVDGRQCRAHRRPVDTDKGEIWYWVVDYSPPAVTDKFYAPYPLANADDAKRYFEIGIDGLATPPRLMDRLGWKGTNAKETAVKFRELVYAYANNAKPEFIEKKLEAVKDVHIPTVGEERYRAITWKEMEDKVRELEGAVVRFRDAMHYAEQKRDKLELEIETLRGEMSRLADLLI